MNNESGSKKTRIFTQKKKIWIMSEDQDRRNEDEI